MAEICKARRPLLTAVLALTAGLCGFGSALAQEPIRIGAFLSVTGPAAFLGDPEQKTLEMYVDRINAAGGVVGRKLQLVVYDDGGDADKARTFAKSMRGSALRPCRTARSSVSRSHARSRTSRASCFSTSRPPA